MLLGDNSRELVTSVASSPKIIFASEQYLNRHAAAGWFNHRLVLQRQKLNNRAELRKRPVTLSITHKVSTDGGPQFDISETGQASPHDQVAGWRIGSTSEIAPELCDLG